MKKDHFRDYATAAFRHYRRITAKEGSVEKYRRRIFDEAEAARRMAQERADKDIKKPTEAAVIRGEEVIEKMAAEFSDLDAVAATINAIQFMCHGKDIIATLELVYMDEPDKELKSGEISDRVRSASRALFINERTLYRWLRLACWTFAEFRGLRIEEKKII